MNGVECHDPGIFKINPMYIAKSKGSYLCCNIRDVTYVTLTGNMSGFIINYHLNRHNLSLRHLRMVQESFTGHFQYDCCMHGICTCTRPPWKNLEEYIFAKKLIFCLFCIMLITWFMCGDSVNNPLVNIQSLLYPACIILPKKLSIYLCNVSFKF